MRGSQGLNWFSCAMILLTGGKKYDHTVTVGPASGPRAVSSASLDSRRTRVLAGHRTPIAIHAATRTSHLTTECVKPTRY